MKMTEVKCSMTQLQNYRNAINADLKTKGITDFTKYKISIKNDKLNFKQWDYPSNIPQPINIIPLIIEPKYQDVFMRFIIVDSKEHMKGTFDIKGNIVVQNNSTKPGTINEKKFGIIKGYLQVEFDDKKISHSTFTGRVRFLVMYTETNNNSVGRAGRSSNDNSSPLQPIMYAFSSNILNSLI
jgi:hypothetical protein